MAQLTICLDEETINNIISAAVREQSSVSQWVATRLAGHIPGPKGVRFGKAARPMRETELWTSPPPDHSWDD